LVIAQLDATIHDACPLRTLAAYRQSLLRIWQKSMEELDYGPVFVSGGRLKGRVLYYDDDYTPRTAICYIGHPLSFAGTYDVPLRFLREATIDELMTRREQLWRKLIDLQ
jgi:hypothetical protein